MGASAQTMVTTRAFALALAIAAAVGAYPALRAGQPPQPIAHRPVWTEIAWPFPLDQWGRGRAFRCSAADCGSEVDLYLRAKLGFCNCASAIDDEEVDRIADFDLIGGERIGVGLGRPVAVHWMEGRGRRYALRGPGTKARSALAVAFHDRCDMVVATAVVTGEEPAATHEDAVIKFLNGAEVRRWAEATLGL